MFDVFCCFLITFYHTYANKNEKCFYFFSMWMEQNNALEIIKIKNTCIKNKWVEIKGY